MLPCQARTLGIISHTWHWSIAVLDDTCISSTTLLTPITQPIHDITAQDEVHLLSRAAGHSREGLKSTSALESSPSKGPRGTPPQSHRLPTTRNLTKPHRQTHKRSLSHRRHILPTQEQEGRRYRTNRNPPRLPQECGYTANCQVDHPEPNHRCDERLQIQDALRIRAFPHQRQH